MNASTTHTEPTTAKSSAIGIEEPPFVFVTKRADVDDAARRAALISHLERNLAEKTVLLARTLDKVRAAELREQGASYAAIGEELGFSASAIRYTLDDAARAKKLEANRRYNRSPAGRAAQARYNESPRGRARDERYYYSGGYFVQYMYALRQRISVNTLRLEAIRAESPGLDQLVAAEVSKALARIQW